MDYSCCLLKTLPNLTTFSIFEANTDGSHPCYILSPLINFSFLYVFFLINSAESQTQGFVWAKASTLPLSYFPRPSFSFIFETVSLCFRGYDAVYYTQDLMHTK